MRKDLEKLIRYLYLILWVILVLNAFFKITFNYITPIVINNEKTLKLSIFIDNNYILKSILNYFFYMFNVLIISLCCINEKWYKRKEDLLLFIFVFTLCYFVKLYNFTFGSILGIILYFLLPLIITKQSKKYILMTFIIDNIYMILSNYNRDLGVTTNNSTFLVEKICYIDYYILLFTYYIGGVFMGMGTILPWFSKKETILKAKIKKYETKVEKLKAKLCSKK